MIRKLQTRFIRIALVSLTVAMVLVVGIVNVANWISVRRDLSDTMSLLVPEGAMDPGQMPEGTPPPLRGEETGETPPAGPEASEDRGEISPPPKPAESDSGDSLSPPPRPEGETAPGAPMSDRIRHFRNMVAESNWFSGLMSAEGEVGNILMDQAENLDEATAEQLIRDAAATGRTEGFLHEYLYRIRTRRDGSREVVLLNCETRLATVRTLILISALACAGGVLLAWLLVMLSSRKAVEPVIRNMEQQKQFITNASHELKTPLTVISTNMELLQMEQEDNPWVRSTQKQTSVMRKLVDELVYLSRMEEEHPTLEMEPLDPGALLEETAEPFISMAEYQGREMRVETEKNLKMTGDRASLQRLMSTLCDNAVKYASEGPILAEVRGEGKNHILLRISNPVSEPLTRAQCEQLFDRFYRVDPSRNKDQKSGFGIGLAIAAAIAEKHGGRITAAMEGNRLVFSCLMAKENRK